MSTVTTRTVTVNVTREHIELGHPGYCARCPVALALLAAIPGACLADVYFDGEDDASDARAVIWLEHAATMNLRLPPEADRFINAFDVFKPVDPFTFTAEVTS